MSRSRRLFLASSALCAGSFFVRPASGQSAQDYSEYEKADRWMQSWMKGFPAVSGALHVGRFADRMYYTTKEIAWSPGPAQEPRSVRVPIGFVTDFASIPRIFWSIFPPDGKYTYACILHDYLYWEQAVPREEADLVLKYAMGDFNIDSITIQTVYVGVRAGGLVAWNGNATLKTAGERRILKDPPEDPTTRWEDIKKRPEMFR